MLKNCFPDNRPWTNGAYVLHTSQHACRRACPEKQTPFPTAAFDHSLYHCGRDQIMGAERHRTPKEI
jgi:hypothetical protein